ncbi:MAG: ferredoxin [Acidimicrobiia bacterium]|jgi:ferredoxin|nr:ferredoxin [Actinomycetota bacterium]NDB05962.1 ferredoxin [Acidimicrobiia bacterium]NDA77115.1 ferredoxin [Actinomycetota bacterium]NDD98022.1 ferredoxin [Actinomycetota bacterium]NDE59307.1 ferredoxin [Acidimicrobiia bacterium]
MAYRIVVDKNLCISSGKCVGDGPRVFKFDSQELAEPIADVVDYDREALLKLARNCPGEAITIFDETGASLAIS